LIDCTGKTQELAWLEPQELKQLSGQLTQQEETAAFETYVLGRHPNGAFHFAASCTAAIDTGALIQAVKHVKENAELIDMRALMTMGSSSDMAMAGHAAALANWHNVRNCLVWDVLDVKVQPRIACLRSVTFVYACLQVYAHAT
jgi:NADH pyrophosphatase NudC (nudix superfamily)